MTKVVAGAWEVSRNEPLPMNRHQTVPAAPMNVPCRGLFQQASEGSKRPFLESLEFIQCRQSKLVGNRNLLLAERPSRAQCCKLTNLNALIDELSGELGAHDAASYQTTQHHNAVVALAGWRCRCSKTKRFGSVKNERLTARIERALERRRPALRLTENPNCSPRTWRLRPIVHLSSRFLNLARRILWPARGGEDWSSTLQFAEE